MLDSSRCWPVHEPVLNATIALVVADADVFHFYQMRVVLRRPRAE